MWINLGQPAQDTLNKIIALNGYMSCDKPGSDTCLDALIDKEFNLANLVITLSEEDKNDLFFLRKVSNIQSDGRSCPGMERYQKLLSLTNGEWKKDNWLIGIGIVRGCVVLEQGEEDKRYRRQVQDLITAYKKEVDKCV